MSDLPFTSVLYLSAPLPAEAFSTTTVASRFAKRGGLARLMRERLLLIQAGGHTEPVALGTARIEALVDTDASSDKVDVKLEDLRLLWEPFPLPGHEVGQSLIGEMPASVLADLSERLRGGAFELAEAPQAGFDHPQPAHLQREALGAFGMTCAITGIALPDLIDDDELDRFVIPIVPAAFDGTLERGNLLVATPPAAEAFLLGDISADAEKNLLINVGQTSAQLRAALNPTGRLLVPTGVFAPKEVYLRYHRYRIFLRRPS